jgi:hypothetical protein
LDSSALSVILSANARVVLLTIYVLGMGIKGRQVDNYW